MCWDELNFDTGIYRNLHYGIIHSNNSNLINSNLLPYVNEHKLPKKFTLINDGDLILADTSEDRKDAAKGIEIINNSNEKIISGLHTIHLREKNNETVDGYKAYYVASKSFRNFAVKYCEGIKVFSVKTSLLRYAYFSYPVNKKEQEMIVNFFNALEDKKTIIERKISLLKKYKEGLIKRLINSSNSMIDISKIIKVCEKTKFGSSDGSVIGKYKFFINSSNDEIKYINNYTYDGEYLVLNTGGSAFANYVNERFSAMSDCLIVKPTQNYSMSIYYWLKASEDKINYVGFQGTGLKHLDINWLLRQKVKIIDYDNKKLLSLNEMIDSIIKLNSSMLDWLKKLKSYLLSNLFI